MYLTTAQHQPWLRRSWKGAVENKEQEVIVQTCLFRFVRRGKEEYENPKKTLVHAQKCGIRMKVLKLEELMEHCVQRETLVWP